VHGRYSPVLAYFLYPHGLQCRDRQDSNNVRPGSMDEWLKCTCRETYIILILIINLLTITMIARMHGRNTYICSIMFYFHTCQPTGVVQTVAAHEHASFSLLCCKDVSWAASSMDVEFGPYSGYWGLLGRILNNGWVGFISTRLGLARHDGSILPGPLCPSFPKVLLYILYAFFIVELRKMREHSPAVTKLVCSWCHLDSTKK